MELQSVIAECMEIGVRVDLHLVELSRQSLSCTPDQVLLLSLERLLLTKKLELTEQRHQKEVLELRGKLEEALTKVTCLQDEVVEKDGEIEKLRLQIIETGGDLGSAQLQTQSDLEDDEDFETFDWAAGQTLPIPDDFRPDHFEPETVIETNSHETPLHGEPEVSLFEAPVVSPSNPSQPEGCMTVETSVTPQSEQVPISWKALLDNSPATSGYESESATSGAAGQTPPMTKNYFSQHVAQENVIETISHNESLPEEPEVEAPQAQVTPSKNISPNQPEGLKTVEPSTSAQSQSEKIPFCVNPLDSGDNASSTSGYESESAFSDKDNNRNEEVVPMEIAHFSGSSNSKSFSCKYCQITFVTKLGLQKHSFVLHLKEKMLHKCKPCKKAFLSEAEMKRHETRVHGRQNEDGLFPCRRDCDKVFNSYSARYMHEAMHVGSNGKLKRAQCKKCEKSYGTMQALGAHMKKQHTPEK